MTSVSPSLSASSASLFKPANPKALQPLNPQLPTAKPDDIDWARKLDRKMEYGYVPSEADQQRYNRIVEQLKAIRDGGGYVYQDTTSFSNNPRGVAAIGSLVGRGLSGGYIGYRYSGEVSGILGSALKNTQSSIANGEWLGAVKNVAIGLKQTGAVSLKAGGLSSALNAGTSVIANVAETLSGRQSGSEAVGNVTADAVGGFISGFGASVFSGVSTLGLSLAGATGLPLTLIGVAGGAVGSVLLDQAYKASGLFSLLKNKVMRAIDGIEPKGNSAATESPRKPASVNPPQQTTSVQTILSPQLLFAIR